MSMHVRCTHLAYALGLWCEGPFLSCSEDPAGRSFTFHASLVRYVCRYRTGTKEWNCRELEAEPHAPIHRDACGSFRRVLSRHLGPGLLAGPSRWTWQVQSSLG